MSLFFSIWVLGFSLLLPFVQVMIVVLVPLGIAYLMGRSAARYDELQAEIQSLWDEIDEERAAS